jgi:hypothetical protein
VHRLDRGEILLGNSLNISAAVFYVTDDTAQYSLVCVCFNVDLDVKQIP